MLYFTSFGFGVAALLFKKNVTGLRAVFRPALSLLMATSILHHAKKHDIYAGKRAVHMVDETLAHAIAVATVLRAITLPPTFITSIVYSKCLAWLVSVYKVRKLTYQPGKDGELWHASIHFTAFIGLMTVALHERILNVP